MKDQSADNKFTFYEVEIKFNNPTNPTHSKTFSVKKRFKEFDTLHTDLVNSLKANTKKSKDKPQNIGHKYARPRPIVSHHRRLFTIGW